MDETIHSSQAQQHIKETNEHLRMFRLYRTILICLNYRSELSVTNVRTYGPTLIILKASFFKSSAWAFLAHKYKLFYYVDFKMIKWGKLRHRPSDKIVKKIF